MIEPEDVAPIVELVAELEDGSGGHESRYGTVSDITWSFNDSSLYDYVKVHIQLENWRFWNGEQLDNLRQRIDEFEENHERFQKDTFFLEQGKPVKFGIKIFDEEAREDV